jgi:hypothetical protein
LRAPAMGVPDQQYFASRQRAVAVRDYLISRFHLETNRVGRMTLPNLSAPEIRLFRAMFIDHSVLRSRPLADSADRNWTRSILD